MKSKYQVSRVFSICAGIAITLGGMYALSLRNIPINGITRGISDDIIFNNDKDSVSQKTIYVNPSLGTDDISSDNTEENAYRTITFAMKQATPGTVIQLSSGKYNDEKFPLIVKPGVTLRGNEDGKGEDVEIVGGGFYYSRLFARQNITLLAQGDAKVSGITITNNKTRGTAIWVESGEPIIQNNTFIDNKREGVFVTGSATPRIENNHFLRNSANGISTTRQAGGKIRNNLFEDTGFGLAIGGDSTPLVSNNKISSNRNGIVT